MSTNASAYSSQLDRQLVLENLVEQMVKLLNVEGCSISSFDAERAFDGAGLGLSVCMHYANLLHGHIDVESEPGQGSRFTLAIDPDAFSAVSE